MGEVIGDLNARRGKILSMEARGGAQVIDSRVPLAAMFGYATRLRSITQGRATYTMQFAAYEPVPQQIYDELMARSGEGEPALLEDQQPAGNPEANVQSGPADAASVAPPTSFISQARQAAQMAAQSSELSVGKAVQKTRLSVVAAVAVVVLSVAGARLWLARTSTSAPRSSATGNTHILNHAHHVASAPSRSASRPNTLLARAEAGDVHAQLVLGVRAFEAPSNPQSDKDAFTWLSRAASHGEPIAQCYLAMLYQKGRGVAADARQAFHLYSASASAGNRLAMNNLAVAYAQGAGVNRDVRQAALWFSEAADRGLIEAQFDLAVLYERGLGVPQSLGDAYRWYTIAAQAGDSESKARAEAIATELSPAERDAADQDAARFKPLSAAKGANAAPRGKD
jgi:localization factor PodJL